MVEQQSPETRAQHDGELNRPHHEAPAAFRLVSDAFGQPGRPGNRDCRVQRTPHNHHGSYEPSVDLDSIPFARPSRSRSSIADVIVLRASLPATNSFGGFCIAAILTSASPSFAGSPGWVPSYCDHMSSAVPSGA